MLVRVAVSVGPRFTFPSLRWGGIALCAALLSAPACSVGGKRAVNSPEGVQGPLPWNARELGAIPGAGALPAPNSLAEELVRLDLLLDLFDAARFGPDAAAAELLWTQLELTAPAHGAGATRRAITAMLDRALSIETAAEGRLDENSSHFLSSAIQLLNVDANLPHDAETLELQLLALRDLSTAGHPRVADNARWRLYDHVRDALSAAPTMSGARRMDVGLHALLAQEESLGPWLGDGGPHDLALRPGAEQLVALAKNQLEALEQRPEWKSLARQRGSRDEALFAAFAAAWPDPPRARLPRLAAGSGRAESGLPRLLITARGLSWTTDGKVHPFGFSDTDTREGLRKFADAGGMSLFVDADETLPAPDLAAALRATANTGVQVLELGIRESRARVDDARGELSDEVWTQLPLRIVGANDHGPETQAFREGRLELEISGRGAWLWADGLLTHEQALSGEALSGALEALKRAYPKEAGLRVRLHPDLRYPQLLDALVAALGRADAAPGTHFRALAWLPDQGLPVHEGAQPERGAQLLAARLWQTQQQWELEVVQPFPMRPEDQGRADAMAQRAKSCWVELGLGEKHRDKLGAVELTVQLAEGGVLEHDFAFRFLGATRGPKLDPVAEKRTHECLKAETQRLRLPSHRDAFEMTFRHRRKR